MSVQALLTVFIHGVFHMLASKAKVGAGFKASVRRANVLSPRPTNTAQSSPRPCAHLATRAHLISPEQQTNFWASRNAPLNAITRDKPLCPTQPYRRPTVHRTTTDLDGHLRMKTSCKQKNESARQKGNTHDGGKVSGNTAAKILTAVLIMISFAKKAFQHRTVQEIARCT